MSRFLQEISRHGRLLTTPSPPAVLFQVDLLQAHTELCAVHEKQDLTELGLVLYVHYVVLLMWYRKFEQLLHDLCGTQDKVNIRLKMDHMLSGTGIWFDCSPPTQP